MGYYEAALELWPATDPARLPVVHQLARMLSEVGRPEAARDLAERELEALEAQADPVAVGAMRSLLGHLYFIAGDLDRAGMEVDLAVSILERQPPSPELVFAYGRLGASKMFLEQWSTAIEICEKALVLAEELGVEETDANLARQMLAVSRIGTGDLGGFALLEDAIERGEAAGLSQISVAYVNLGSCRFWAFGPGPALEAYGWAQESARRRGAWSGYRWARAESLWTLHDLGQWDDVLRIGDEVLAAARVAQVTAMVQPMRARVLAQRGDLEGAAAACASVLPLVREIGIAQVAGPAFPIAAAIAFACGDRTEAVALLRELAELGRDSPGLRVWYLDEAVRTAVALGEQTLGEELIANIEPVLEREVNAVIGGRAILAEAAGEPERAAELYRQVAERWAAYGYVVERAHALAGLGRCAGDRAAAAEARDIFVSLGVRAPLADVATG
jgi:tetratricopeptide (TPR) repeat protein